MRIGLRQIFHYILGKSIGLTHPLSCRVELQHPMYIDNILEMVVWLSVVYAVVHIKGWRAVRTQPCVIPLHHPPLAS
jgi:hypothetical protein